MLVNMLNVMNKNWGEDVIEFILISEDTLNAELSWMVGPMSICLMGDALSSTRLLNILVGRTTLKDAPYDDMSTKYLTSTEELQKFEKTLDNHNKKVLVNIYKYITYELLTCELSGVQLFANKYTHPYHS